MNRGSAAPAGFHDDSAVAGMFVDALGEAGIGAEKRRHVATVESIRAHGTLLYHTFAPPTIRFFAGSGSVTDAAPAVAHDAVWLTLGPGQLRATRSAGSSNGGR
jgi:hypothetical protein